MSDIKESFYNKLNEMREERLDEMSPDKLGRYIRKASDEKHTIQKRGYDNKLEKGDLPKFEKRKKGVNLAMKKTYKIITHDDLLQDYISSYV